MIEGSSMDEVRLPHKQLGAEVYYYVMINASIKCLILNRLQKSDGRKWKQKFKLKKYYSK